MVFTIISLYLRVITHIMTEKQEKILKTALRLFANEGYAAISTNRIAREAGVSEGLIFRHFKNKEGLLNAIKVQTDERLREVLSRIIFTTDAKELIRNVIEMPFRIDVKEHEAWRLTYTLKWQMNDYDGNAIDPLRLACKNAFTQLGYLDPESETEILMMFLDGAATAILLHPPKNAEGIKQAMLNKYFV